MKNFSKILMITSLLAPGLAPAQEANLSSIPECQGLASMSEIDSINTRETTLAKVYKQVVDRLAPLRQTNDANKAQACPPLMSSVQQYKTNSDRLVQSIRKAVPAVEALDEKQCKAKLENLAANVEVRGDNLVNLANATCAGGNPGPAPSDGPRPR